MTNEKKRASACHKITKILAFYFVSLLRSSARYLSFITHGAKILNIDSLRRRDLFFFLITGVLVAINRA